MPGTQRHIIRRQLLEVETDGSEREGIALHRDLPDLCARLLAPAIEQVLERYAPADRVLTIERLDIDAGNVSLDELSGKLPVLVAEALEKELSHIQYVRDETMRHLTMTDVARLRTVPETLIEAFCYFLENGTLPWSFTIPHGSSLESEVAQALSDATLAGTLPASVTSALRDTLRSPAARQRLVRQFSPEFVLSMPDLFSNENRQLLTRLLLAPNKEDATGSLAEARQRQMLEAALAHIVSGQELTESSLLAALQSSSEVADKLNAASETTPGKARLASEPETQIGAFCYFLENGTLPRSLNAVSVTGLEAEVAQALNEAASTGGLPASVASALLATLRSPVARQRLVRQFSAEFILSMPDLFSNKDRQLLTRLLLAPDKGDVAGHLAEARPRLLLEAALSLIVSGQELNETSLIAALDNALRVSGAKQHSDDDNADRPENLALPKSESRQWDSASGKEPIRPSDKRESLTKRKTLVGPEHPDKTEGLYIDHAGLVLLHPFLPQFFRGIGIAEGDELLMPNRALHLLHFLATGAWSAPEYELPVMKVLCGLPLEYIAESEEPLLAEEDEEVTALLSAVIRHWEALKNTGPDGLREAFLKRAGKLSFSSGEWWLQVESKGYDILLDQLPWGISMIQLPWMPEMLRVEWFS